MGSLRLRILISVSLLLIVFFGIAIFVLDSAFRDAATRAQEERLDIQLIALLAAAEPDEGNTLKLPQEFQEPRLSAPGSGLYAAVFDGDGEAVWRSRSTLGVVVPWTTTVTAGMRRFDFVELFDGTPLLSYTLGVDWEFPDSRVRPFTFHVVESLDSYNAQVSRFRRQLFVWFGVVAAGLLLSLGLLLGWLLQPLARIAGEIHTIEQGEGEALSKGYPSELAGVARNLNALIRRERSRGEIYRRTLDDLAHSLKTPLATLKTILTGSGPMANSEASAQLDRMDELIRYQLAKPAARGRMIGAKAFPVAEKLEQLVQSFAKIYHQKSVDCDLHVDAGLKFSGDQGDFMELTGNVMDNAFKRCNSRVRVRAQREEDGSFTFRVDDDGPGFPAGAQAEVLARGARLDEADFSQGIGLAIVADICELYGAAIELGTGIDGGASVAIRIPAN